jgi:two-component system nitrogen regulation response regulator NtrX
MPAVTRLASTALLAAGRASRDEMEVLLRESGFEPIPVDARTPLAGIGSLASLCLVDLRDNGDAIRVARAVRARHPQTVIIGVADPDKPSAAADALRAGVFDVLPRPASPRDLDVLLANAREQSRLAASAASAAITQVAVTPDGIVGTSAAMRGVMELVQRAAGARCGIMLCGERGTGREMIARSIHAHAGNAETPFVKIDCSGPSPEDVELDLFGVISKRVESTGAERRIFERVGDASRLLAANGGVLFLENVAELPARAQARLVRILRDREVFVNGAGDPTPLEIRPIASVEGSVENAVEEGRLRPDLHERLTLIRIDIPSLRQRRDDIPILATHFLKEICQDSGQPLKTLTRPALTLLSALPWPGNVPELRALLERLLLLVPGGLIRLEDVLAHTQIESRVSPIGFNATLRQARARFERDYIAAVLQHHHGRIADAAKVLGVQRTNLYRKLRRLNLMQPKGAA